MEEEKSHLHREIDALQHEKKNLHIQLQLLQNQLTSDESSKQLNVEETIQLNSSRELPSNYRRLFERHLLSTTDHQQDEEIELNNDSEEKLAEASIEKLNSMSLDQSTFLDLIREMVEKMTHYLNSSNKYVRSSF